MNFEIYLRSSFETFKGVKAPKGYYFVMNGFCREGDEIVYMDNSHEKACGFIGNRIINGVGEVCGTWYCCRKLAVSERNT